MTLFAVLTMVVYAALIFSLRWIFPENKIFHYLIRKSVHLFTGLILFVFTFYYGKTSLLFLVCAGVLISTVTFCLRRFNFIHATSPASFGTLFYPVGILVSLLILRDLPMSTFRISLLVLAVSDTIANFGGLIRRGNIRFNILKEDKSLIGAAAFALSAALFHRLLAGPQAGWDITLLFVFTALNFELISYKGSDNFSIPVGCALFFLLTAGGVGSPLFLIFLFPAAAAVSFLLYKIDWLSKTGAIAAYTLGIYLFAALDWRWVIPLLFFFITATLFTRLRRSIRGQTERKGGRNVWQVGANGLVAFAASLAFLGSGDILFAQFYIAAAAAVTADTWSSELGPIVHRKCLSLADMKIRDAGISGGLSFFGTAASFAGALSASMLGYGLLFQEMDIPMILILAAAGFLAAFVDSLLGAFVEPFLLKLPAFSGKDRSNDERLTPNDLVNLTASATAPLFVLLLM
jgi:uncharacterized protein (TIGR00297 family)